MQTLRVSSCSPSRWSSSLFGSFLFTLIFFATMVSSPLQGQESAQTIAVHPPLITRPIDESQLTTLKGNTHPLARPVFDLGTAPADLPMQRMLLVLKRSPAQEASLRKLLDDQQDKGSPNYHKWLTPEEFGKKFGPTDDDLQKITAWLQSHGFQVGTTKGRTVLEFSGSAGQVKDAFHTTIHKYAVNGEQHWANASDPMIPTALTPAVAGVLTLHNFVKKPTYRLSKSKGFVKPGKTPEVTFTDGSHGLVPGDYALIYNLTNVYAAPPAGMGIDGTGITIGVIGRSDIQLSDVTDFATLFNLSFNTPTLVLNGPDPGDISGDDLEGTLDVTWSQALAPGSTVDFVISATTNTADGVDLSEAYIIENNLANVMTESFGFCEAAATDGQITGTAALAEQAAAQGITYTVSTGDSGAEGCDDPNSETVATGPVSASLLASNPFTVAVGGTVFNENGNDATYWSATNSSTGVSVLSYIPEDVWNDSCLAASCSSNANIFAGGGGASTGNMASGNGTMTGFPKPSWQSLSISGMPNDGKRDLPDVSLTAATHDGYALCFQGSCPSGSLYLIGGTSASTPSFAAIMALVDEKMGQVMTGGERQGQANYVLYSLASQESAATLASCNGSTGLPPNTCIFNDVTMGNNAVPGELNYGLSTADYQARTGYDLATGLGSVNVASLITAWPTAKFLATTTTLTLNGAMTLVSITHGQSVAIGVTVAPTPSSGTSTPTGDVSLIAATTATGQSIPPASGFGGSVFTLSSGSVTASTTQLPGGDYTVTAHYAGDGTFASSDSAPGIPVAVTAENSTTALSNFDLNGVPIANGTSLPFGSGVFVRADVAGASGQGIPSGSVTFADAFGSLPQQIFSAVNPVVNPSPLNSRGNTSIADGMINFDAGNHSISGVYSGDASFKTSSSASAITFTIQPGFAGISGPTDVTITAPGMSGTTTVGIIASTGFGAITFTCGGLPSEATCSSASATGKGPNTVVNTNITVTTTAAHTTMLQSNQRRYYYAVIFGGGMPLAGILLLASPKRRRWSALLGLVVVALLVTVPACGGGGGTPVHQQDPGTPAGTYAITVTAASGSLSAQGGFTLTVQ